MSTQRKSPQARRSLVVGVSLCAAVGALGSDDPGTPVVEGTPAATQAVASGVAVGPETVLTETTDSDFVGVIVDEAADSRIVTRDAKSGALRYLRVHAEHVNTDELISPAASAQDRQNHQSGMILEESGEPVVWSAGHQFRRDAGSGQWKELDATIACERIVVYKSQLVCAAVVPGKTFNAPKHWIGGIIGGPGAALPWAWRVNTDTLGLFGEEQGVWQPLAVIDRDSKVDATGPYDLAVDARGRLHILSSGNFHHAVYPPPADSGQSTPAGTRAGGAEAPRRLADVHSDPVVLRFTPPNRSSQSILSAAPAFGAPGPSLDAVWGRSFPLDVTFDPRSEEFTLLRAGYGAAGKAFSTAPDTWLGTWTLHDNQGAGVQVLATEPQQYLSGRLAASSNGKLHAIVMRRPKGKGPMTLDYMAYDGASWSAPIRLNESQPYKTLYGLAADHWGHLVVVTESADGKLVARTIIDAPPQSPAPVASANAEPTPTYKPRSGGAMGIVVSIALADIGIGDATVSGVPVKVADRRAEVVMERTALGRPMGLVGLQPTEHELVTALVTAKWQQAQSQRGLSSPAAQLSCDLQEFSITTPSTLVYWDVSTRVRWVLRLGDRERTVTASAKRRTFAWPSEALIKQATVEALKAASAQTEQAIGELLGPAAP